MKEQIGLTHIYCGDGKGKTTAAMGLALRAAGSGLKVVIVQFLKNGTSSEFALLKDIKNISFLVCNTKGGFSYLKDPIEKQKYRVEHKKNLVKAIELCNQGMCDVLILDEILGGISCDLIDCDMLIDFLKNKKIEVILTGRNPSDELIELADYVSEINKVKHPYDKGIPARIGIDK